MAANFATVRAPMWEDALDRRQVMEATAALVQYVKEKKAKSTDLLEDDAEWINLFVRYKTIPSAFCKFPVQLYLPLSVSTGFCTPWNDRELPTPFWNAEEFRICLIMDDTKIGKRVKKAKEMLVPGHVTEVMSALEVRQQFHDAELKRELCKSYDLFLMEKHLKQISSGLLGGRFVEMKKFPVLVKLTRQSEMWKAAVENVKQKTQMYCYVQQERSIRIGRSTFSPEQLTENLFSVVKQMTERPYDQGWNGVMQMYVCTGKSVRLPVYQTFPDEPMIELKVEEGGKEVEEMMEEMMEVEEEEMTRPAKRKRLLSRQTHELTKRLVIKFAKSDAPEPLPLKSHLE